MTTATTDGLHNGLSWVAKHWPRVRLGHEGMMLEKIERQGRIVEQLAKNAMTGERTDVSAWPGSDGDDKMGVSIGDQIHNYYQTTTDAAQQPTQPATGNSWLKTLGIPLAAAALGAGGLAGYNWLMTPDENPPAVVQPADDGYLKYSIGVGPGPANDQ